MTYLKSKQEREPMPFYKYESSTISIVRVVVIALALFAVQDTAFAKSARADSTGLLSQNPGLRTELKSSTRLVHFATTSLNESAGSAGRPSYGRKRHLDIGEGSLDFGTANFRRPSAEINHISKTNWSSARQTISVLDKYWQQAHLASSHTLDESAFYRQIASWNGRLLVFSHGYAESFEGALRDAAALADELEARSGDPVMVIAFNWPSQNNPGEYAQDETNISWSQEPFNELMEKICRQKKQSSPLDLVAHSLGSKLVFGLLEISGKLPAGSINKIILSSPDFDYFEALQKIERVEAISRDKVFVLVSDRDGPLITSQLLHGAPRLGRPVDPPAVAGSLRGGVSGSESREQGGFFRRLLNDASDILMARSTVSRQGESAGETGAESWVRPAPSTARDLGGRTRFIDLSEIVTADFGHRLSWTIISQLLSRDFVDPPLNTEIVIKRPLSQYLEQTGGKTLIQYRFHRVTEHR